MSPNILQKLYHRDLEKVYKKFNGIILDNVIGDIPDLQTYFEKIYKEVKPETRILISYHNPLWEPVLTLASTLGLRRKVGTQNWLDQNDLNDILSLSGFETITSQQRFLGITTVTVARKLETFSTTGNKEHSVSIVIPARNEEGNIPKIIPSIPKFGKSQELIFIEGGSKDKTWEKILEEKSKRKCVIALKQMGKGKADAAWQGLKKATGDILIIYDADRTVDAKELLKFYNVLTSGLGEFANGNRLLYPMEGDAMQTLNKIGNQIFSWLFTWILGQRFKDTLCGTKAFWRRDFNKFKKTKTDPFGDFDLIFSAIRNNLKIKEIPVRYKERVYGKTNINRFYHGLLLIKMIFRAFKSFRT